jgi:glycosyltransferase involved in cell wall biosynthesis
VSDPALQPLSIIVTCKGRLDHLKQSLPRMAAQTGCECIVVDYECPDGAAQWVRESHPHVKTVEVRNVPRFNVARARNLGAKAATREWLAFLDADILIEPGFSSTLAGLLGHGRYFRPAPLSRGTCGSVVCHRGDFFALAGYDETLEGYGGEDNDLYFRLNHFGRSRMSFDAGLLRSIPHDDHLRSAHHEIAGIELNRLINASYNHIKYDLMRESGQNVLPAETRRAIYAEVKMTLVENWRRGERAGRINITLPVRHVIPVPGGWAIRRRWTFDIEPIVGQPANTQ